MGTSNLRKIGALSTDAAHTYEYNSCFWIVFVTPNRSVDKIRSEFNGHDCGQNSLSKATYCRFVAGNASPLSQDFSCDRWQPPAKFRLYVQRALPVEHLPPGTASQVAD
jgi:hypothetical protein